jgi:Acetoacetate decarboxylase (ADC)
MNAMPAARSAAERYVIQGREVRLPVVVRDASSGAATYAVSAAAARRLIPGDALEPVEVWPGKALCSLAVIQYRDNDLGDYNEVSIAFFVREKDAPGGLPYLGTVADLLRGRVATYIRHLPVDQGFTCEAGRTIWGFPKTVERIDVTAGADRASCTLHMDGAHVLTLAVRRGGARRLPDSVMTTYSFIDGAPHKTAFSSGGDGVGFRLGGATLTLGTHPIADELRSLGLPKRALMTMWMERMHGRFEGAVPF